MQRRQSVQIVLLVVVAGALGTAVMQQAAGQQAPPSEPYSHHFDPYSYGYESEDNHGNKQWRQERSNHPHEVHGSYGYRDNHGVYREVTYVADQNGFRANIKTNEPGVAVSDKSPASTKLEAHYSAPAAHSSGGAQLQQYSAPAHHQQPAALASPPVYARQHYAPGPAYYQGAV